MMAVELLKLHFLKRCELNSERFVRRREQFKQSGDGVSTKMCKCVLYPFHQCYTNRFFAYCKGLTLLDKLLLFQTSFYVRQAFLSTVSKKPGTKLLAKCLSKLARKIAIVSS